MCDQNQNQQLKKRHSFYTTTSSEKTSSQSVCKSDANIYYTIHGTNQKNRSNNTSVDRSEEYYKKYEYDETPVKDDSSFNDHSFSEDNDLRTGDNKDSITNSDLDKLEMKILRRMSQELQLDTTCVNNLDSNIKLFKSTVQQIFDMFYNNMKDIEVYKRKFNEILEKNKEDSFSEMEDFIKDMIQSIGSSDSSFSNKPTTDYTSIENKQQECKESILNVDNIANKIPSNLDCTVETFLNENYLTDSSIERDSSKIISDIKREETFNIYVLSDTPYLEIKMINRDMFSEINIREQDINGINNELASAENIKKLAAKMLQLKNYAKQQRQCNLKDRDIPIRISSAKKNIHLDEDFTHDKKEENQFFIFKICDYICRKFRKSSPTNS